MEISVMDNYYKKRFDFFKWNRELSLLNKVVLAFFMACVTGILAQIVIPLPWTPVPVTGQTFAVLMAGVVLGRYWGGMSQVMYVAVGLVGVPWFAGMTGGFSMAFGATAGYLIGFILAALLLGHFTDKYIKARSFTPMLGLMLLANFAVIYIPGLIGLGLWMYLVKGAVPTLWSLLAMGLIPFVIGDLVKIAGAAGLTKVITPKEPYCDEVDSKAALN
ncbi:biotin transporter BioY [Methanobacterium sp. ACI-7]|uniref:biotin transporter BioY n=1 Tax=unclassified Methanobacterium TaxID=2627676 RepID=UPI0039C4E517